MQGYETEVTKGTAVTKQLSATGDFGCVNYTASSKGKGNQERAQASPCWQHLRTPSETAKHPPQTPRPLRFTPLSHVLSQSTPRWPRRCSSEHGSELQRHASALYGLSTTRACCRSFGATAISFWYATMPTGAFRNAGLTRVDRLWRCIQHERSSTVWPTCPRRRKTNWAAANPPSRPPTTGVPDLSDAPRHG